MKLLNLVGCLECCYYVLIEKAGRPCQRCINLGKQDTCVDVQHKKRGRPRLRDEVSMFNSPPSSSTTMSGSSSGLETLTTSPVTPGSVAARTGQTDSDSQRTSPSSNRSSPASIRSVVTPQNEGSSGGYFTSVPQSYSYFSPSQKAQFGHQSVATGAADNECILFTTQNLSVVKCTSNTIAVLGYSSRQLCPQANGGIGAVNFLKDIVYETYRERFQLLVNSILNVVGYLQRRENSGSDHSGILGAINYRDSIESTATGQLNATALNELVDIAEMVTKQQANAHMTFGDRFYVRSGDSDLSAGGWVLVECRLLVLQISPVVLLAVKIRR